MKDWFRYLYNRILPPDTPRLIRKFAKWTFIFFAFFGLLMSLKPTYPIQMLGMFLMFLFLAVVTSSSVILGFRLLMLMTRKTNNMKLDAMYEKDGFTPDMAFICKHSNPFGYGRDRLMAAYLYTMCEDFNVAKEQIAQTEDSELTERLFALKQTCRMQIAALSGGMERADTMFQQYRWSLSTTYANHPLLTDKYRPYLDDALTFYMLGAVLSVRAGEPDGVEQFRTLAQSRLAEMRSAAQAKLTEAIFELNLLYAQGRLEEADSYAIQLEGEISMASALPQGRRDDLHRMVGQARIYADVGGMLANGIAGLDVSRDRPLPGGTTADIPPISAEHGEHPDEMASIPYL